jgi:ADP-ribose pyrophosphatase YjhB (NUDIX family)
MTIINEYKEYDRMLIAVDCIIFGFDGENLKALLIKRDFEPGLGNWSLMGGFIKNEESVDAGAARVLQELTGLTNIYMEQLYCFGEVNRDPAGRVVCISKFWFLKNKKYIPLMVEHKTKMV